MTILLYYIKATEIPTSKSIPSVYSEHKYMYMIKKGIFLNIVEKKRDHVNI